MKHLSDPEQRLLERIRRTLDPSEEDQARISSLLKERIALSPFTHPEPVTLTSSTADGTPILGMTLKQALVSGLIAALSFGAGYGTALSRRTPAAVVPSAVPVPVAPVIELEQPAPPAIASTLALSIRGDAKSAKRVPAPGVGASESNLSETYRLGEEALELRRADRALRGNLPRLALAILDDLDRRIPRGKLLEEREAARLMARCANGDATAFRAAAAWLENRPRSLYSPRLEALCRRAEAGSPADDSTKRAP